MRRSLLAGALVFSLGCSVLTSYPEVTAEARRAFQEGRFQEALLKLPPDPGGADELLFRLERGLIAHSGGQFEEGRLEWLAASDVVKGYEGRPTVSMRSALEGLASLILNDKTLPYDGEGFERVLLHAYLALDYYFLGQTDSAFAETRVAYETQREEEKRYETTYHGQGAFAHYLTGLLRETVGEWSNAYIEYRKVHEIAPGCRAARADLLRLARKLGYGDDLDRWRKDFGSEDLDPLWEDPKAAEVLLLFQCGLGPIKRAIEIAIPHRDGITKFAAPVFEPRPNPVAAARLLVDGRPLGTTDLLEDVESVARKNLDDRIAWVLAKASARTVGKALLTRQLEERHRGWGAFLGSVFALVTEQADLRSWLTLPRNFQILRSPLAAGEHHFSIELLAPGGNVVTSSFLGRIRVRGGERVVVNLRSVGASSFAALVGGERIEPKETSP